MQKIKFLEFDSEIFGFSVAKILSPRLARDELKNALDELRKQNVRLVYWAADSEDTASQETAVEFKGFLGCHTVTYLLDLTLLDRSKLNIPEIEFYSYDYVTAELEKLSAYAGNYSHLRADPQLPKELFYNLYKRWIANCVNGVVAHKVLIIRRDECIAAMVSVGEKNMRGDIGLLAVNENYRGQHLGVNLVCAAQAYFIDYGYKFSQVVTQAENIAACKLYEKCGYTKEKVECFYHFWL